MTAQLPRRRVDAVFSLESCDSTQREAHALLTTCDAPSSIAVAAREQTRGHGREGRAWVTAPGESLLVSIGVRDALAVSVLDDLSRRVALGVRAAITLQIPHAAGYIVWKAPNDLLDAASGAKLGGVLIDARTVGSIVEQVIVGIGLNLDAAPFVLADGRTAGSVRAACAAPIDAERLCSDVIEHVAWLLKRSG